MKKTKKFLKRLFFVVLVTIFFGVVSIGLLLEPKIKINGYKSLDMQKLDIINNNTVFTDKDGQVISGMELIENTIYVPISQINSDTQNAFIAAEDKRFLSHNGIDYVRIFSALLQNIKHLKYKEGGSTITQQLIKNTHLNGEKTLKRKIQEVRIAKQLERNNNKDEILEYYLNSLYFGNGIYGIGTAAKVYFDKAVDKLSIDESAALAGIINSPSRYNPYTHYENCIRRRNLVLERMKKNNLLSEADYINYKDITTEFRMNNELFNHYQKNALFEAAAILNCEISEIKSRNYKVNTFYDDFLSKKAYEICREIEYAEKNETEICALIFRNFNSEVVAACSTGTNSFLNARRSPGSTIKPLLSYSPAIESSIVCPATQILDEKKSFRGYEPSNYKDNYLGYISVEDSLACSSNIVAVKLLDMCGIEYSKSICKKMGIDFDESDDHLALALGAFRNGLTLHQIANAYQAFPNGGTFQRYSYIKSIEDENGNSLYTDKRLTRRALKTETAFLVNKMLQKCVSSGTARRMKDLENVGAKTGTVGTKDGNTDAYCISYTKDYTVAVWIGAKSGYMPNNISGGTIATKINKKILFEIKKSSNSQNESFEIPEGIEMLAINKDKLDKSHKVILANELTPKKNTIEMYFDKKNTPAQYDLEDFNSFILQKDYTVFSD